MNASGQTVAGPAITTQDLGTGILQLTFDQPGSSANVFGQALLKELDAVLDREVSDPSVHAVIFCSAKASIFIAGADIRELASVKSHDEMRAMIQLGQRVFQRIIDLPQVTVAAIHGACLGGGYELCLACDIRVASDDRATSIGLPETSLGIVPAWGGCTRLAPLIGLPNALDVIMGGKRLAAKAACKRGMVDEVVPKEHLIRAACRAIEKGTPNRRRHIGVNNGLVARFVAGQAQKRALARTRGHYPAVERALSIVTQSLSGPPAASLKREEEAIIELSATETCRNLIGIYFLQERSKRLSLSPGDVEVPQSAAVIGAGAMGAGIAQWLSSRGHPVILRDIANEALLKGLATAQSLFTKAVK
ncbi:MAG: enoyl-CoA hydratase-related protein, partial [Verrucomicrobia bacterium]|nr:enoyl-CoA hydratase-related protein [Verrucomicrobiota bacterium]